MYQYISKYMYMVFATCNVYVYNIQLLVDIAILSCTGLINMQTRMKLSACQRRE